MKEIEQKKTVHIGLMKCGSTFLQHEVFPHIIKLKNLKSNLNNKEIYKVFYKHYLSMLFENKCEYLNLSNDTFISSEKLVGYIDPHFWEEYSNKNLKAFGKDTHILIVIREPKEFLSSVYLEACTHANYLIKPKYFFLNRTSWSSQLITTKFSIDEFSYLKLINIYKEKFDKVSIIKFEDIFNLDSLAKLFNLNQKQLIELNKLVYENNNYKKNVNRSYSKRAVKFLFIIKKIIGFFHLQFAPSIFRQIYIDQVLNINNEVNKKETNRKKHNKNLIIRFLHRISSAIDINTLIWSYFDRFFYDEKFFLDFNELDQINLVSLKNEYDKIKTDIL